MIVRKLMRGIPVDQLAKHVFISGVPGSGKSTTKEHIKLQLFRRDIPFIALEPGKAETRRYKCLADHADPEIRAFARALEVYTPGNEEDSPFRLNPLAIPPGISQEEHIENLRIAFEASMSMLGSLPASPQQGTSFWFPQRPPPLG